MKYIQLSAIMFILTILLVLSITQDNKYALVLLCLIVGFLLGLVFSIYYVQIVAISKDLIDDNEEREIGNLPDNHSSTKIDEFLNSKCEGK